MLKEMPLIPQVEFPVCDVRDVALAHIKAMSAPEAKDHRHIIVSVNVSVPLKKWALVLQKEFKSKDYFISTMVAPNYAVKFLSNFDKSVRRVILFVFNLFRIS
jgi:nucleoside-diphosphate-sugar epimerase